MRGKETLDHGENSLTEAEAFVPVTLKTLYKHGRVGKLSTTKDALGNICVDPAELERVYGQLHLNGKSLETPSVEEERELETPEDSSSVVELLKEQLADAKRKKQKFAVGAGEDSARAGNAIAHKSIERETRIVFIVCLLLESVNHICAWVSTSKNVLPDSGGWQFILLRFSYIGLFLLLSTP